MKESKLKPKSLSTIGKLSKVLTILTCDTWAFHVNQIGGIKWRDYVVLIWQDLKFISFNLRSFKIYFYFFKVLEFNCIFMTNYFYPRRPDSRTMVVPIYARGDWPIKETGKVSVKRITLETHETRMAWRLRPSTARIPNKAPKFRRQKLRFFMLSIYCTYTLYIDFSLRLCLFCGIWIIKKTFFFSKIIICITWNDSRWKVFLLSTSLYTKHICK